MGRLYGYHAVLWAMGELFLGFLLEAMEDYSVAYYFVLESFTSPLGFDSLIPARPPIHIFGVTEAI